MTCPIEGCGHPAGSVCTMTGCPGRFRSALLTPEFANYLLQRASSRRACKGAGLPSLWPAPVQFSAPFHEAEYAD
jgi:hypothetical protein